MLLALPVWTRAQPPAPRQAPLAESQVLRLVKGSVPASRIADLVATYGIDFEPTEDAIGRLRSAGAPEAALAAVRAATGPAERKRQEEKASWDPIKDSPDPAAFEDFLSRFPDGQFAAPARRKQRDLKIAGVRGKVEQALGDGRWDEAEGLFRALLPIGPGDEAMAPWQRQIAEGREKLRLEREAAAARPAPPPPTAAGATKVNPADGLTYVWIPPGAFTMGCSPADLGCLDDEKPAHPVTIGRGFWLGRTPVTQQAYQRVRGENPSDLKGPSLPVESLDWNAAKNYCLAIGGRLPTEAEWEYAARAGSTGARYGNLNEIAWYSENSLGKTHEVGRKQANAFGLYDMLGNVWEWVADWSEKYSSGAQTDPTGAESGGYRVLRGGSWGGSSTLVRVSARSGLEPTGRRDNIGFRCAGE